MFSFYTSLKHETSGFLIFLVGIVGEHSPKMDLKKVLALRLCNVKMKDPYLNTN